MSMEEKNEWVINYIDTLVKGINEQYGNIIKEDQRNKAIFMYKDSDKTIDQIKAELDELVKELIKNYLKGQQKVEEKEKHYNLNDFFDCRISNNTLHIHVVPKNIKDDISRLGLGEYYKYVDEKLSDALSKIPAILKEPSNKNIKSVFAVSKLLRTSNAKKIFSKYGFDTSGVPDKIFEEMFHTDRIGQAIISREKFMSIYDKNNLNDEMDVLLSKLNKSIELIENNNLKESIINTNDSYNIIKIFCETIPHNENIFDKDYIKKTYIPIDISKSISKEVINKISPIYNEEFEEYVNNFVKFEKGESTLSKSNHILYEETISDVYVIIHEFFHYYCKLSDDRKNNISPDAKLKVGLFDEAKSILSEEIVSQILKEKMVDLGKYDINLSNDELNYFNYIRLYSEREMSGLYLFLKNTNEILENNKVFLTYDVLNNYFSKFDKQSIEYKTYRENINSKFFKLLIKDENMFNNDKYYNRYKHPISYIMSLELSKNMNIESNDFSKFNRLVDSIKNLKNIDELDTQIVKNGRIDASKTEYVQGLLLDKKQKIIDIKQIEQVSVALKSRKQEINKLKKQKLELTKEQLHNTIQKKKEKSKVLSLNNNSTNGFIDIIFGSIITIIIGLIMFILIK